MREDVILELIILIPKKTNSKNTIQISLLMKKQLLKLKDNVGLMFHHIRGMQSTKRCNSIATNMHIHID